MRRALVVAVIASVASLSLPGRGAAQQRLYFGAPADTALGLIPGAEIRVPIRAASYVCGTVQAVRLTIRYDSTKVQLVGVLPAGLDTVSTSRPGPGLFSVLDSGTVCGSDVALLSVRMVLGASVTDGTFLWMSVDSVSLLNVTGNQAQGTRTTIAQMCHATNLFGDVDGNGRIDSRDALIVLSAAVGLPVTGFNLAVGDVDRDGLTNSRDALLMLSYAINLPMPNINIRIGEAAPDACPGTSAPGEAVVFKRNGSGIELLGASSTTPALVAGTVPGDSAPRLASNGTTIIYQCQDSVYTYYTEICSINTGGTGRRPLTPGFSYYTLPDLSPDGYRVLYQYYYYGPLYLTSDTGGTSVLFPPGPSYPLYPYGAAWSRDSGHVAYTSGGFYTLINAGYSYQPHGLYKVDTLAASFVQLDTAYASAYVAPRWSPAGDSVAYVRNDGRIWVVPATGGGLGAPLTNFWGTISGFDWGTKGLIFSLDTGNHHPSLWLLPSQNAPIRRITGPVTGDWQPSFRRQP
jgi:hypothetical protein